MKSAVIQIAAFTSLLGLVMALPGGNQFLDAECGIRAQHRSKRVINGTVAAMYSSPWMAFLHSEGYFIGGGTLITNRLVLTTAAVASIRSLTARLGEYVRSQVGNERKEHTVEKAIIHPYYNKETNANDISILLLQGTVVYNANIKPICIVGNTAEWRRSINDIQKLTGTGWGKTENEFNSDELRTLDIWRKPPTYCAQLYDSFNTRNQFCAGSLTGSMCNGDAGSPVGAMVPTTKGERFVQIGIASYNNEDCRSASVFTDVLSHMSFILRVWRQHSN